MIFVFSLDVPIRYLQSFGDVHVHLHKIYKFLYTYTLPVTMLRVLLLRRLLHVLCCALVSVRRRCCCTVLHACMLHSTSGCAYFLPGQDPTRLMTRLTLAVLYGTNIPRYPYELLIHRTILRHICMGLQCSTEKRTVFTYHAIPV